MKEKHKLLYMRIAEAVALTSSATRLKVGAVAVKNNMVIGTGYNALPSGIDGECEYKEYPHPDIGGWIDPREIIQTYPLKDEGGLCYRLVTRPEVHHSELNLIINLAKSTESSQGCEIFCTHACCKACSHLIVDSGCKKFYYRNTYRDTSGLDYLISQGVEVEKV